MPCPKSGKGHALYQQCSKQKKRDHHGIGFDLQKYIIVMAMVPPLWCIDDVCRTGCFALLLRCLRFVSLCCLYVFVLFLIVFALLGFGVVLFVCVCVCVFGC